MTVRELIAKLQTYPLEAEVCIRTWDETDGPFGGMEKINPMLEADIGYFYMRQDKHGELEKMLPVGCTRHWIQDGNDVDPRVVIG